MNFDKLPNEIKRMIFDRNREAAKDNRYTQNFEMLQLELRMLFEEEEERPHWSTGDTGPSDVSYLLPFDPWNAGDGTLECADTMRDELIRAWYASANRKILPWADFVLHYILNEHWLFGKFHLCVHDDDPRLDGIDESEHLWWLGQLAVDYCKDMYYLLEDEEQS